MNENYFIIDIDAVCLFLFKIKIIGTPHKTNIINPKVIVMLGVEYISSER